MKERILIFGTGTGAQRVCRNIDFDNFEIVAFIDNNKSKYGSWFLGKRVVSPQEALDMIYDRIVICSVAYKEIRQQLIDIYQVNDNVICNGLYLKKHNLIKYYKDKVEIVEAYLGDKVEDNYITIDELLKGRNVNYIKMDIEGSEIAALKGAKQTLQNENNLTLNLCTYHRQSDYNEVSNILQSFGYSVAPSKGYMVFLWEDTDIHKLVRGLIRVKK